jgi:peptidoglycan glycosyltransferase
MRSWFIAVAALGLAASLLPVARYRIAHAHAAPDAITLTHLAAADGSSDPTEPTPPPPVLAGIDLAHIGIGDDGATAITGARQLAHLTIDPDLQHTAVALMSALRLPEAAIVMMDPSNGQVLVYESHVERGEARDLCVRATAPAASLFKVITGAALVDVAGLGPDTRQCYSGGEQRIMPADLVDDAQRDRWCVTLAGAMGRSVNAVFARLAQKSLTPDALAEKAKALGFGEPLPFDAPVEPSTIHVPPDPLGFARTAAGFWNTTLSPIHAAYLSAMLARGGEAIRPNIVRDVVGPAGTVVYTAPSAAWSHRVVSPETAQALATMMEHTVSEGTSYKAFHDAHGTPFLPGLWVAGKTGTLTDDKTRRFYTWFTAFAPSRPLPGVRPVAIAVLVVNHPAWHYKANVVAREMLRAYFAAQKVQGVTGPTLASIVNDGVDDD